MNEQMAEAIARKYGWSPKFAEGFLKGEYSRRSSAKLSRYCMVGIDDYSAGFRAGYFGRRHAASPRAGIPAPPAQVEQSVGVAAIVA